MQNDSMPALFLIVVVWVARRMGVRSGYAVRWILKRSGRSSDLQSLEGIVFDLLEGIAFDSLDR